MKAMDIVMLGLSLTSSWGNGHATTYRALIAALRRRGHRIHFLERDVPWYARQRDLARPDFCTVSLYRSLRDLDRRFRARVESADVVVVGSYVPEGIRVGRWARAVTDGIVAFYDIDTPVTLEKLEEGDESYISRSCIPEYDLYLSFAGGPVLDRLELAYGAPLARALYCSVDPVRYAPPTMRAKPQWELGYLGTYSDDRQPTLDALLVDVAMRLPKRSFIVAGPKYPPATRWPANVQRIEHLAPARHRRFYVNQRSTLNVTRSAMRELGYAPSVRLFEAAACATPIISDRWPGIEDFFTPGREIILARDSQDVVAALRDMSPEELAAIGERGRRRVLARHTCDHRAREFEQHVADARSAAGASQVSP